MRRYGTFALSRLLNCYKLDRSEICCVMFTDGFIYNKIKQLKRDLYSSEGEKKDYLGVNAVCYKNQDNKCPLINLDFFPDTSGYL